MSEPLNPSCALARGACADGHNVTSMPGPQKNCSSMHKFKSSSAKFMLGAPTVAEVRSLRVAPQLRWPSRMSRRPRRRRVRWTGWSGPRPQRPGCPAWKPSSTRKLRAIDGRASADACGLHDTLRSSEHLRAPQSSLCCVSLGLWGTLSWRQLRAGNTTGIIKCVAVASRACGSRDSTHSTSGILFQWMHGVVCKAPKNLIRADHRWQRAHGVNLN